MLLIILAANNESLWLFFGLGHVEEWGGYMSRGEGRGGSHSQRESTCRDGRQWRRGWQFRDEG